MTKEELELRVEELEEEVADLESELDNARDEIDTLQDEVDGGEQREQDAYDDGFNKALERIKEYTEEIEV
jgi:predicted  nucleic acid-binding Zn-ribbon protein